MYSIVYAGFIRPKNIVVFSLIYLKKETEEYTNPFCLIAGIQAFNSTQYKYVSSTI